MDQKDSLPARVPFWMVVQAVFNHIFVDYLLLSLGNQRLGHVKFFFFYFKIFYESESRVKKKIMENTFLFADTD